MLMDAIIDQFEEQYENSDIVRPEDVIQFLSSQPIDVASDWAIVFELAKVSLELSWMRWPDRLSNFAEQVSPDEALSRFQELPRAYDFFSLFKEGISTQHSSALAESEFLIRSIYGDFMPEEHYVEKYATTISTTSPKEPLRVIDLFPTKNLLDTALYGLCSFGRQRSTDPDDLLVEKRAIGRRIIIAPRQENRVSRYHMELQLLSRKFAILHNTGSTNKLRIAPAEILGLGEKRLIRFPFEIILPHRRLKFHQKNL